MGGAVRGTGGGDWKEGVANRGREAVLKFPVSVSVQSPVTPLLEGGEGCCHASATAVLAVVCRTRVCPVFILVMPPHASQPVLTEDEC